MFILRKKDDDLFQTKLQVILHHEMTAIEQAEGAVITCLKTDTKPDSSSPDTLSQAAKKQWEGNMQIESHRRKFPHYSDYLMFEAQNEEFGWSSLYDEWDPANGDREAAYALVNEINQNFVNIVRSSDGNNPKRHLLISGYNTDIKKTCAPLFKMPDDPAGRCAVSVHYYTPVPFCILEEDAEWAKMQSTWGTEADYEELYNHMDMMKTTFIDMGIPVIIGEYGCPQKNKEPDSIVRFISSVCKEAYNRQLCPVLWDVTDLHYDRNTCKLKNSELQKLLAAIPEKDESVSGDVNGDGSFSVADVVMLQKWLNSAGDVTVKPNGDYNKDGVINVFDICLMKKELIS